MQNGGSRSKKFIKIPGEEVFMHTFKFNASLPVPPIPYAKTLYYPLDSNRYSKPKLTFFHLKSAASLLTRCDLGIPVDEINMKSYIYNGNDNKDAILDEEDEMIINETIKKKEEDEVLEQKEEESSKTEEKEGENNDADLDFLDEKEDLSPTNSNKIDESCLKKIIENTFVDIKKVKVGMSHPKKPGVHCVKVHDILPKFEDINVELICIGDENLKNKLRNERYIIQSAVDVDKQEIFKVYDSVPMISIEQGKFSDPEKEEEENPENKEENLEQNIEKDEQSKKTNLDTLENNNNNDKINEETSKMELEKENPANEKELMDIENHEDQAENPENTKKPQKESLLCKLKVASVEESKFTNFELNREYEFRHMGNYMFTKTLVSEIKKDYLLSFNQNDENAYIHQIKANFFIRKNKYTSEVKAGRQQCIKINIDNINKEDLLEMKERLTKINFKTDEIQSKIDNLIEEESEEKKESQKGLNFDYGSDSESSESKEKNQQNTQLERKLLHKKKEKQENGSNKNPHKDTKKKDSDDDLFAAENSDDDDSDDDESSSEKKF